MDNIELFNTYRIRINCNKNKIIKACSHTDDNILCFIADTNTLSIYNKIESTSKYFELPEIQGEVKYIQHLPLCSSIFLCSETELAIFDIAKEKTTVVHTLESKILDLAWDSIQSALVLIDTEYQLYLYSVGSPHENSPCSLYNICKTQLTSKVPESVMVGWGSQRTQFQGPKQKQKEAKLQTSNPNICDGPPKISWRGNGEQFVINFFKDGFRYLKVFDNQFNPLFESVENFNLREPTSFMGQGQYIASCITEENVNHLIIFEKNCKMKAITELKQTQGFITKVLFHPQMSLLGILSKDEHSNSFIDIYLYSNACWLLKHQLCYNSSQTVHDFFWTESDCSLFTICKMVIFTNEEVEYKTFRFTTNSSQTKAITGVINGKLLNIHLFENAVVPPPMYSFVYEHKTAINRILFHPDKCLCLLLDSHFQFTVISIDESTATLISSGEEHLDKNPHILQVDWGINGEIIIHTECKNYDGTVENQKVGNLNIKIVGEQKKTNSKNDLTNIECLTNKILDNSEIVLYQAGYVLDLDGSISNFNIILNACKELSINNEIISTAVTSCTLFKKYLIWTTAAGMLYCIRDKQFNKLIDLSNVFERNIEQGSRIVCCNNMTPPQIILQLPRGNLETIRCKMITIDIIDEMLAKNEWENVIELMRMEKINWNVLVDLDSKRFYDHIGEFVRAAKFHSILSAIVCDFDLEKNCFQTLYKNYAEVLNVNGSINKKCIIEKILDLLCTNNCVDNLRCIVAIQQKHVSLKSALISIKQVYNADMSKHEAVCNKAIKQLLQQAHLKDILNESFTLFDLAFLSLIYRNSNEDPKVYGPELSKLHNMHELERRFHLCLKAYNFKCAVKYLLTYDKFDEEYVVTFITQNKLEHDAYDNICKFNNNNETDLFKLCSTLYAKRLTFEAKYGEAGIILKRAELFEESLLQFQRALEWREVIVLANKLNYTKDMEKTMLENLASELLKVNRLEDAITIYEYHIQDYKKAISSLVEFKSFRRAVSMARIYDELDCLDNLIIPSLKNYTQTLMEKLDMLHNKFHGYVNRLQTVREYMQKKLDNRNDMYNGESDLYSETSSIYSGRSSRNTSSSRHSSLSSRNQRKEAKKKIDLREGGFYEDIALMRVLHLMYNEVHEFAKEVREVCLIEELDDNKFCKDIHKKLINLQKYMGEKIGEIWPEIFYKTPLISDSTVQIIIQNKNDLDPQYAIPPSRELLSESWKLNMFS